MTTHHHEETTMRVPPSPDATTPTDRTPEPVRVAPQPATGAALDLDAIRRRADAATPGPWKTWAMSVLADPVGNSNLDDGLHIANTADPHRGLRTFNADFIAAARQDVPALVDALARVTREAEALRAQVAQARTWIANCVDPVEVGPEVKQKMLAALATTGEGK